VRFVGLDKWRSPWMVDEFDEFELGRKNPIE